MACHKMIVAVVFLYYCQGGFGANALDIPEECKGKVLCDIKPSFYDGLQEEVNKKFHPIKKALNLDTTDERVDDPPYIYEDDLNCRSMSKVTQPYLLQSNGTAKIIVQTEYFEQTFRTTECVPSDDDSLAEGDQCFDDLTTISTQGRCKTKQSKIILYVYDSGTRDIERVAVPINVCCVCSIN